MNPLLSRRDIEALSAYLDGELDSRERARVEILLNEDPEMREALNTLQQTRALVRSLPKVKVPRNFSLTPEMVGQEDYVVRGSGLGLTMRWASAVASILLVLVFVGDLLSGGLGATRSQPLAGVLNSNDAAVPEMQAAAPAFTEEMSADEAAEEAFAEKSGEAPLPDEELEAEDMVAAEPVEEEPMAMEAAPAEEEAGEETFAFEAEEAPEAEEALEEEAEAPAPAGETEADMAPQVTATAADTERISATEPEIEAPPAPQATPTAMATQPSPPQPTATQQALPTQAPTLIPTETFGEQAGGAMPEDTDMREEPPQPPTSGISTLRVIEIVLLLAALGSGITAFVLRRRS
jgi:anti-sigma factor RsiW